MSRRPGEPRQILVWINRCIANIMPSVWASGTLDRGDSFRRDHICIKTDFRTRAAAWRCSYVRNNCKYTEDVPKRMPSYSSILRASSGLATALHRKVSERVGYGSYSVYEHIQTRTIYDLL
jgi:hypothetical protein